MRTGSGRMKGIAGIALAALLCTAQVASATECMTEVSSAMDRQRESYIAAQGTMADQNYSRRPGSFASTTCLNNLMQGGGLDIFFKPPSLDSILNMVMNLACEQASQIFDDLLGGSGLNGGGSLNVGEILNGVNLGGGNARISLPGGSGGLGGNSGSILELFR